MKFTFFLLMIFMICLVDHVNSKIKKKERQLSSNPSEVEINLLDDVANFLKQYQHNNFQHNDVVQQHKQAAMQHLQQRQFEHQMTQGQNQIQLPLQIQQPQVIQFQQQSQMQNQYQMNNQDFLKHLNLQGLNNSNQQIINHNRNQQQIPQFEFNGKIITPQQTNINGVHEIRIPIEIPQPQPVIQIDKEETEKLKNVLKQQEDKIGELSEKDSNNILKINQLEQQIQQLQNELDQKQQQIDALEKETKEQIQYGHKEEKLVESANQETHQIEEELEKLKKEKEELQKQFELKEKELLEQIENLKQQNEEEMLKIKSVQEELTNETNLNQQKNQESLDQAQENQQISQENQTYAKEVEDLTKKVQELEQQIQSQKELQESSQGNQEEIAKIYQQKIEKLQQIQNQQLDNVTKALDAFAAISPNDTNNAQRTKSFIEKINEYIKESQQQVQEHQQQLTQVTGDIQIDNQDLETPIENQIDHEKILNLIQEMQNYQPTSDELEQPQSKDDQVDSEQLNKLDHVIDELKTQLQNLDGNNDTKERKLYLKQSTLPQPRKIIQNLRAFPQTRKLPLKQNIQKGRKVLMRLVKKVYDKNHHLIKKIPIKRYYKIFN